MWKFQTRTESELILIKILKSLQQKAYRVLDLLQQLFKDA